MADANQVSSTLSKEDWLMIVLSAAADGKLSPVQVQKALFLLKQEAAASVGHDFYNFVPYNYGPFDKAIYEDLNKLNAEELVNSSQEEGKSWHVYSITGLGKRRGEEMLAQLDPQMRQYVSDVVTWTKSLRFSELVGAIYKKYPEYKANSIFTG